jgi:hypothetical protein
MDKLCGNAAAGASARSQLAGSRRGTLGLATNLEHAVDALREIKRNWLADDTK